MLVEVQKKLNVIACPSCNKKNVLQAVLSCSRDEEKCTTSCQCSDCGTHLMVQIPENLTVEQLAQESFALQCSLITSSCEVVVLPRQAKAS